jgi:predicted transcriptional regulator
MQNIIEEGKQQNKIAKETGYNTGHVSVYIRSLMDTKPRLVAYDENWEVYYVPVDEIINEYCQDSGIVISSEKRD